MLQRIRERAQGWLAWVIIIFISIGFALFGVDYYLTNQRQERSVITINGFRISQRKLDNTYQQLIRQYQMSQSGTVILTPKIEKNFRETAKKRLMLEVLLKDYAQKNQFYISPYQVDAAIQEMPLFQVDGRFSNGRFKELLQALLLSPLQFMQSVHDDLLSRQYQSGIINTTFALPFELQKIYQLMTEERNVRYLLVSKDLFYKESQPSMQQMQVYYNQHKNQFLEAAQIQLQYLELSLEDLIKQQGRANPSGKENAEKQFANRSEQLANLTFSNPSSLEPAAKALALPLKTTKFFSKNLKDLNLRTGILKNDGVITQAFSPEVLQQKNNSDLIKLSENQVVVIRVLGYKPKNILPFSEVQDKIKKILFAQNAATLARQVALEVQSLLQQSSSKPKQSQSAQIVTTKQHSQHTNDETQDAGLQQDKDESTSKQHQDTLGVDILPERALQNHSSSAAANFAYESSRDLSSLMQRYGLTWQKQAHVSQNSKALPLPMIREAFSLPLSTADAVHVGLVELSTGFGIVQITAIHPGKTLKPNQTEYAALADQICFFNGENSYLAFMSSLVQTAKIKPAEEKKLLINL